MERIFNFSAGPSMLPLEIIEQAAAELTNYHGCGMSVMEMSHRSQVFQDIIDTAEADLRELMNIPEGYKVLFLQGGGTLQFSMVPLNLLRNTKKADYIVTGQWAKKACQEARKFGDIRVAELGFLGVTVFTEVHTPLFCGDFVSVGTLLREFIPLRRAGAVDFLTVL